MLTKRGFRAFAEDDFEVAPFPVDSSDLTMWTLDLMTLASCFRSANGLSGEIEVLDSHLWFLGHREVGNPRTVYVLALLNRHSSYIALLNALPSRLPAGYPISR